MATTVTGVRGDTHWAEAGNTGHPQLIGRSDGTLEAHRSDSLVVNHTEPGNCSGPSSSVTAPVLARHRQLPIVPVVAGAAGRNRLVVRLPPTAREPPAESRDREYYEEDNKPKQKAHLLSPFPFLSFSIPPCP